jgi:TonB family protein
MIRRDGRIADTVVEQSSGGEALDSAAERAVALTRELPPLPGAYPDTTLTIHLRFEYGAPAGTLGAALRSLQEYSRAGSGKSFGPSIQFDTKGVEFGPWIRRFVAQMKRSWFIPYAAMSKQGHVVITFNVQKNGTITDIAIHTPSGVDAFDNAARGAVIASSQTYPLPPEYPADRAFFTVTFYYNETPPQSERTLQPNTPALPVPDLPLPDEPASSLLRASVGELVQRLGKPSQIDGHRWTYRTSGGTLAVYFDDADTVVDIRPRAFDLSIFKK